MTNKTEANGASAFTLSGTIDGLSDVSISTVSNAQGGSEPQTKESIRFNAPLQYSAQDRAVTTSDYEKDLMKRPLFQMHRWKSKDRRFESQLTPV